MSRLDAGVGAARLPLRIRTTRGFVRVDGTWRQRHHHGAIEAPERLADHQRRIFGHVPGPDA